MENLRIKSLAPHQRALVAIAVLLDGHEAAEYLQNDSVHGNSLARSSEELAKIENKLRLPLLGTFLRAAVDEIDASKGEES